MFPKMTRTHSTGELLNTREILLNQNGAGPKQLSHQRFQDWVCPRSFCCAIRIGYAIPIRFGSTPLTGNPRYLQVASTVSSPWQQYWIPSRSNTSNC